MRCQFCQSLRKSITSRIAHEVRCKQNPNRKVSLGNTGKKAWNNGLSKMTDSRVASYSENMKGKCSGLAGSEEGEKTRREKLSKAAKRNNLGGHTSKMRLRFLKSTGEEVLLQSSYEIKFATILEDLNIEWSRPAPLLWVDAAGSDHRYYPDFKIGNLFVDTKNPYLIKKDEDKIRRVCEQNNVSVIVVPLEQINTEFIRSLVE